MTAAPLPAPLAVPAAAPTRLALFYEHCGVTCEDVWDCACNDRCPVCNQEIEPLSWSDLPPDGG